MYRLIIAADCFLLASCSLELSSNGVERTASVHIAPLVSISKHTDKDTNDLKVFAIAPIPESPSVQMESTAAEN